MNELETISGVINEKFSNIKGIKACYIFGSLINGNFVKSKSDIDILLFCDDLAHGSVLINQVILAKKQINFKTDISIVFMSEFRIRKHIYRETFFLWIVRQSKLIFGEDLLSKVLQNEFTPDMLYRRIVDLAQSSRSVLINSKEQAFWIGKYQRWLRIFCLELLYYLEDKYICDYNLAFTELITKYPELDFIKLLEIKELDMKTVSFIAENLKSFIEHVYFGEQKL